MESLFGLAYLVIGGIVVGKTIHLMHCNDVFRTEEGDSFPLVGFMLMALLFWLVWPIVWGVTRAEKLKSKDTTP